MIDVCNRRYCWVCKRSVGVNAPRGLFLPHFGSDGKPCPNGGELINATAKRIARCHVCGKRRTVAYEWFDGGKPRRFCRECFTKSKWCAMAAKNAKEVQI